MRLNSWRMLTACAHFMIQWAQLAGAVTERFNRPHTRRTDDRNRRCADFKLHYIAIWRTAP